MRFIGHPRWCVCGHRLQTRTLLEHPSLRLCVIKNKKKKKTEDAGETETGFSGVRIRSRHLYHACAFLRESVPATVERPRRISWQVTAPIF